MATNASSCRQRIGRGSGGHLSEPPLLYQLNFAAVIFQVVVPYVLGHCVEVVVHGENEAKLPVQKPSIDEVDLEKSPERS